MREFDVSEYKVRTDKIPAESKGFKFIMISDLHSNDYKVNLHKVNEVIVKEKPDGIILAGDIINRSVDDIGDILRFLNALAGHYPVFYALGNHEYALKKNEYKYGNAFEAYKTLLQEYGIVFLEDDTIEFTKDNAVIALSGVEIDMAYYGINSPVMGGGLMDKHLGCPDKNVFQLLIAHNPKYFDRYAKWGADLVLSGHLHGGIVRLPALGGVVGTDMSIFPKYDGGIYRLGKSRMIVSRGLGTHTVKIRINNKPELVIVKILAKKD